MKTRFIVIAAGMMFLAGIPMFAHHSFAGTYLEDVPPVKVEGILKEFLLRNPHSFIIVADDKLKDEKGEPIRWSIEWAAAGQLAQQGINGSSLKVGDHVIVTGSPGRNPAEHRLRYRALDRPLDGFHNGATFN
jgi:Family of unknown function (DUF6152)